MSEAITGNVGAAQQAQSDEAPTRCWMALFLFAVLSLSFCSNIFSIAEDRLYQSHSSDPEALVVGRLLESESYGLTSNAGLLIHNGYSDTYKQFRTAERPIQMTSSYLGQAGAQGWVFSAIDVILYKSGVAPATRLAILRDLAAAALAAVLSIWIYFLSAEFGAAAALGSGLMILYSSWLTVFADNLYWVPVTWFIPALLAWYWTVYRPERLAASPGWFYCLHGAAVMFKALCGFEYITAVVGASGAVFVYGIAKMGWRRSAFTRLLMFAGTSVAAIVLAFAIQTLLVGVHLGSLSAGIADFVHRVQYRSLGGDQMPAELVQSLQVSLAQIISTYLHGAQVENIPGLRAFNAAQILVFLLLPLAAAALYIGRRDRGFRTIFPAILLVLGSLVASISWHIAARGHSFIHTFLNYVVWFVPLFIILPAVTVYLFREAFLRPYRLSRRAIFVLLALVTAWTVVRSPSLAQYRKPSTALSASGTPETNQISLRVSDAGIDGSFGCDTVDLLHPFFLRLDARPESAPSSDGATTLRFLFREKATSIELNELRYGKCSFRVATPTPFDRVTVGQFADEGGSVVEWKEQFRNPLKP